MLMLREQSLADPSQPWPAAPFFTAAWKSWERVSSEEGVHELALDKDDPYKSILTYNKAELARLEKVRVLSVSYAVSILCNVSRAYFYLIFM